MIHHRRSIRLRDYDYSQPGAYFVTLVTRNRECLFGDISNGEVRLNEIGQLMSTIFLASSAHFHLIIDTFVIMPNHIHAIIFIDNRNDKAKSTHIDQHGECPPLSAIQIKGTKPGSLGAILQNFKSISTRRINGFRGTPGVPVWQRNYYEHIIRNEDELNVIRQYIIDNPLHWAEDDEN